MLDSLSYVEEEEKDEEDSIKIMVNIGLLFFKYGADPTRRFGWLLQEAFKKKPRVFHKLLRLWTTRFSTGRTQTQDTLLQSVCGLHECSPTLVKAVMAHSSQVLPGTDSDWSVAECLNGMSFDVAFLSDRQFVPMLLRLNLQ